MATPFTKKAAGLQTAQSRYDVPEGGLVRASNVLIRRDGVIQPRWSYNAVNDSSKLYTVEGGTGNTVSYWHRAEFYRDYLYLAGYGSDGKYLVSNVISTGTPTIVDSEVTPPCTYTSNAFPCYDIEFVPAGRNLYYTTFYGVRRFDNPGTSDTSRPAGNVPCTLSCYPRPTVVSTGNVQRVSNVTSVVWPFAHGFVVGLTIQITATADAGNFPTGTFTVKSVPSNTTFTYDNTAADATSAGAVTFSVAQFYGSNGPFTAANDQAAYRACLIEYDKNGTEHVGMMSPRIEVTNASPFVGNGTNKNIQAAILFPGSGYAYEAPVQRTKFQVYRSKIGQSSPTGEYNLVYERYLTDTERSQGFAWFNDVTPMQDGQSAYTNDGQDGDFQNNNPPPAARTMALWQDKLAVANVFGPATIETQLLSTDSANGGLANNDYVYVEGEGMGNTTAFIAQTTAVTSASGFLLTTGAPISASVRTTVQSLINAMNWGFGSGSVTPMAAFYAGYLSQGAELQGRFFISVNNSRPEMYDRSDSRTLSRGLFSGTNRAAWASQLGAKLAVSAATTRTTNVTTLTFASGGTIFKVGETVTLYATEVARNNGTPRTIGGTAVTGTVLTAAAGTVTISNTGTDGSVGAAGDLVYSQGPQFNNNQYSNRVCVSKIKDFEAFPALNFVPVGTDGNEVYKMAPCNDSLLCFTKEGLHRIRAAGDGFIVDPVDPTAILWARDSVKAYRGKVMAWLLGGVATCTDEGVEYVSGPVQNKFRVAATRDVYPTGSDRAFAVINNREELYDLRIPNSEVTISATTPAYSTLNLVYNMANNTWTEDDLKVVSMAVNSNLRYMQLYSATATPSQDSPLYAQTAVAASRDKKPVTVISNASSLNNHMAADTADFVVGGTPSVYWFIADGDILQINGYFYQVSNFTLDTISEWEVTPLGDAPDLGNLSNLTCTYAGTPYTSSVEWAPITLVAENKLKMFTDIEVLFGIIKAYGVNISTYTELITTLETVDAGNFASQFDTVVNDVWGYNPANLRIIVPQQHRRGQQLSVRVDIPTFGSWSILGIGVSGEKQSTRVRK